jgi:hypothetical protein
MELVLTQEPYYLCSILGSLTSRGCSFKKLMKSMGFKCQFMSIDLGHTIATPLVNKRNLKITQKESS